MSPPFYEMRMSREYFGGLKAEKAVFGKIDLTSPSLIYPRQRLNGAISSLGITRIPAIQQELALQI